MRFRKCVPTLFLATFALFGEFLPDTLVLNEALEYAQTNNPELKSLDAKWRAVKETVAQVSALPDPRLSYGYFLESVETRTGPQDQKIGISQAIPWFGKLSLKEQIALKEAEEVRLEYIAAELEVQSRIKRAFYEYAWLKEAIRINKEHLDLLKLMESVANTRFKNSDLSQSVLILIQVEQGKLEDRIKETDELRVPLSSSLRALLGDAGGELLPWPKKQSDIGELSDPSELKSIMIKANPMLRKLEVMSEKEDVGVKLAEKDYYPDVTFGLNYIDTDGGDDPAVAMISVNLPVWRNKLDAGKREALLRRDSLEEMRRNKQLNLQTKFDLLLYRYRDAERKTNLYRKTLIPKIEQGIEVAMKGFETGKVGFSDLLDAERTLLEFQLTSVRRLTDANQRLAEIHALVGGTIKQRKK